MGVEFLFKSQSILIGMKIAATQKCESRVRANREKALFSHIWNAARGWGYTNKTNPCQGIKGYKELGRDVYVDGPEYMAVYNKVDVALQEAMDLAWLTAQRPADVLKISEVDIKNGEIWIKQNKTGTKLRIAVNWRAGAGAAAKANYGSQASTQGAKFEVVG